MSASVKEAETWRPTSVRIGDWRITTLFDGTMHLDGGAMWGVVPKNLWAKLTPPAEDNSIRLALRPFLVEKDDLKIVIEVGIGDRWEDKWKSIYHLDRAVSLPASLARLGIASEEITHVIASHCHFDHIGAMVRVTEDGGLAPQFPRARHFVPRIEAEMAQNPDHVRRASYRADDIVPVIEAGLLETYEGSQELLPGIRVHDASGHSDGVSVVTINEEEDGDTAIFWADVVPTTHHIQPPYIMAYDIDVVRSYNARSHWLEKASRGGWTGLFYHDDTIPFGRIVKNGKRYELETIVGEFVS